MSVPKSGPNSSAPTTAAVVGGVYNLTVPVLVDGQACALQLDANGLVKTTGAGGGTSNVNLTGINGTAPAINNALAVELSDGTNPVGTAGNPLSVNIIAGSGVNASVGTTGAIAPTSATEIGSIDGTGKLQGASSSNPIPVEIISTLLNDPAEVAQGTAAPTKVMVVGGKTNDGTPQYKEVPLGTGARSVIIEGVAGGTGVPISGTVTVTQATGTNLHAVLDSGTTTVTQATATNLHTAATLDAETTKVIGTVRNLGNTGATIDGAPAATAPTNALQVGVRGSTTVPTAVTDGQLVVARADKYGNSVGVLNAPRDLIGTAILNSSSSSTVALLAAGGANVFNDIISLIITNETSTATIATLTDNGSGGNTYKFAIAANGGIVVNFPTPLPQGTANAAWNVLNSLGVALDWVIVYAKNK